MRSSLATWLGEHHRVEVVCRDGSAAHAEAIRQAAPHSVQVSGLLHGLDVLVSPGVVECVEFSSYLFGVGVASLLSV
jgi:hypothetical protein